MIGNEPDSHAATTEASCDSKPRLRAADDERTGSTFEVRIAVQSIGHLTVPRQARSVDGPKGVWGTPSQSSCQSDAALRSPAIDRAIRRAAKPAPAIKRSRGPKLPTA